VNAHLPSSFFSLLWCWSWSFHDFMADYVL